MEYWDVYDKDKRKLNKTVRRGKYLADNEFHLVVNVWLENSKGEFLISQRSKNKLHPLMWETTGGSVLQGEDTLEASLREVKEELGLNLNKNQAKFIGRALRYYENCNDILEVYLFPCEVTISQIILQKEEVNSAKWASRTEILKLLETKRFEANPFFQDVILK